MDTVIQGVNGLFFTEPSVESLVEAVKLLENGRFDFEPEKIRLHAFKFDKTVFKEKFRKFLNALPLPEKVNFPDRDGKLI